MHLIIFDLCKCLHETASFSSQVRWCKFKDKDYSQSSNCRNCSTLITNLKLIYIIYEKKQINQNAGYVASTRTR